MRAPIAAALPLLGLAGLAALAAPACIGAGAFVCGGDQECGANGRCEPDHFCSFPAADCPSGRKYGALAGGGAAGVCTGGPAPDGGADGRPDPDAPPGTPDAPLPDAPPGAPDAPISYDAPPPPPDAAPPPDAFDPCPLRGVSGGGQHTCARRADGTILCWGRNTDGQLGDGTTISRTIPAPVPGAGPALAVAAGGAHTCALLGDGTVACWGTNGNGQLGDGSLAANRASPGPVATLGGVTQVASGGGHSCALRAAGTLACWGANWAGQLGDGTTTDRRVPVDPGLTGVAEITAGEYQTCARKTDGTVWCWGGNSLGQLGDGTTTDRPAPRLNLMTGAVEIAQSGYFGCARQGGGSVWCWGQNFFGSLGRGTSGSGTDSPTPAPVVGLSGAAVLAGGGNTHACAALGDGTAWCWGNNGNGQVGKASPAIIATPVRVDGTSGKRFVDVTAGGFHACGVTDEGDALCWGYNMNGQLGDGSTADSATARAVIVTCP